MAHRADGLWFALLGIMIAVVSAIVLIDYVAALTR